MSTVEVATFVDEAEARFWDAVNRAYEFTDGLSNLKTREEYRGDLFGCRYPKHGCKHENPDRHNPLAFLPWCHRWGINPMSVTKAELKRWVAELASSGQASGTQARRVSAVSSFYDSLFADEIIDVNPTHRLRAKEKPKRRTPGTAGRALNDAQALALLDAAETDSGPRRMPERSALLIALMLCAGMRVSEAINLKIEGYLAEGDQGAQITYVAKGGKTITKAVDPYVDEKIRAWLAVRPATSQLPALQAGARTAKRTLLSTEGGQPLTRQTAYRLVRRLGEAAGIPGTLSPHDLRRTYASISIQEGVSIRALQLDMGHAKSETTEGYDRSHHRPENAPTFTVGRRLARVREERERLGSAFEEWAEESVELAEASVAVAAELWEDLDDD
ncbi:tyrosine-type recombinase/integrase [Micromonospora sp. NPDC047730]|uniref:tyrosine-type recombinase/integrase n=1 Tax=Micromonospora sp. NPDC047730 TaxID=3364253 RepID=UPI00371876B5